MDYLWSPWRFRYVSEGVKGPDCPFCLMAQAESSRDRELYILHRGRRNFAFLNLFPYASGHVLIAPYEHAQDLGGVSEETLDEMMALARRAEAALEAVYHPEGFNMGMNIGKCAGAGVADHIHLHFLPRWFGDTNFMSVIGETRVLPEELGTTYDKLVGYFR